MKKILYSERFQCIKDVVMTGSKTGEIAYTKGNEYISQADGRITDNQGNVDHWWCDTETMETSPEFQLFFIGLGNAKFKRQITQLQSAIAESERFVIKAQLAIDRLNSNDNCYSIKEMAAARRAALDVKREMTSVNQLTMWT